PSAKTNRTPGRKSVETQWNLLGKLPSDEHEQVRQMLISGVTGTINFPSGTTIDLKALRHELGMSYLPGPCFRHRSITPAPLSDSAFAWMVETMATASQHIRVSLVNDERSEMDRGREGRLRNTFLPRSSTYLHEQQHQAHQTDHTNR